MALYPGAVFVPTSFGGKTKRNRQGRGILHVAVSSRRSYPPNSGNTWHFYVAADGYCEQYVDTDFCAWASVDANDDAISIETAGGLGNSAQINAEPWTPAQMSRIADIMRWEAAQPGGAPLELLPDSKPGRRGWGPHRLGIKHSAGPRPGWWQPGGEVWSGAVGKECPGDAKVAQVPQLIQLARSGGSPQEDFLAGLTQKQQEDAAIAIGEIKYAILSLVKPSTDQIPGLLAKLVADGANDLTEEQVRKAAQEGVAAGIGNIVELVRQTVLDTLGQDNADEADRIVDALAARLKSA